MKFGSYLTDNATPEWKRAYIDYRACKKAIKRVAARLQQTPDPVDRAEQGDDEGYHSGGSSSGDEDHGPAKPRRVLNLSRSPTLRTTASTAQSQHTGTQHATPTSAASPAEPAPQTSSPLVGGGAPGANLSVPKPHSKSLRSPNRSPGYGAMGTSPRLADGGQSFGAGFTYERGERHHHQVRNPPPLDIGDPTLDQSAAAKDVIPTLTETPVDGDSPAELNRERMARKIESTIKQTRRDQPQVEFSPIVEAVSPSDDTHKSPSTETMGPKSSNEEAKSPILSVLKSPAIGRSPKRSPSGFSPLRSLISSRVQATAGVSPSGMADAPSGSRSIRSLRLPSPRLQPRTARTFEELYDTLQPDERAFFDLLDHELEKVETFYSAREAEATRRGHQLQNQLRELAEHRRIFHETFPEGTREWEAAMGRILPVSAQKPVMRAVAVHLRNPFTSTPDEDHHLSSRAGTPTGSGHANGSLSGSRRDSMNGDAKTREDDKARIARQYDPDRYQKSKKDLRLAMLEFYRHLELIKNYRILNLTGFRKALKKFEKATHIQCLELYTEDRIAPCSFSRGETIDTLIKQCEDLFTTHFEYGNSKRARMKLRQQDLPLTHYWSVFRSGILLGLGIPAAILALIKSYEPETREAIPTYSALLQVYVALYIPVIFAMLFELNLIAWVEARINYEFVMELERPSLDYRSYFEIPALLFCTLSYCMFFSFYRVSANTVAPTTWPAGWLVFLVAFFVNPLPILRRRSRYWLLHVLFRVCTPGYSRVEFIAFFIADELNSLVFTIQNIFFLSCTYSHKWPDDIYAVCPSGRTWPYALLACLPPLARLIQCLKRYRDSNLIIHLINAGKYCSSIMSACMFVYWRSHGSPHNHPSFVCWVVFASIASVYTTSWDFVVDWSLLRPHYNLLRPDLGYSHKAVYYFAMVTNALVRFIWIWYLPRRLEHTHMRSWIFAMCEMLRRWQWNFFRVETEHLGNADAYRVTREIPLPYRRLENELDADDDPKGLRKGRLVDSTIASKLHKISLALVGRDSAGRGPDALNVGPRGHAAQREYEARRPGDTTARSTSGESAA